MRRLRTNQQETEQDGGRFASARHTKGGCSWVFTYYIPWKRNSSTICKAKFGSIFGIRLANNFVKKTPAFSTKLVRIYEYLRDFYEGQKIISG